MTKKQFLLDTLEYYSSDPNRRNTINKTLCAYHPQHPNTDGCAIGRHINDPEAKKLLDSDSFDLTIYAILEIPENSKLKVLLPKWMLKFETGFLLQTQNLHDIENCWTSSGLSEYGLNKVNSIIHDYNLDRSQLGDLRRFVK